MTRLRLEANKIKEVLSANMDFPVRAEQLHAETDLNTKVTRAEFEAACESLFSRITGPIDVALAMANITVDQVHAVELLGGGVRMPRVKKTLDDYFKAYKIEVGQHVNGDEAMALGAAFRAANLSTAFRVRKVGVSDVSSFGVSVQMENLGSGVKKSGGFFGGLFKGKEDKKDASKEGEGEVWVKKTSLYGAKSSVPAKPKTVAFQHDQDILCRIEYDSTKAGNDLPEGTSNLLAVYNITGIAEFAEENAGKGLGPPKIHLSFSLDSSGLVLLSKAEATIELPPEKDEEDSVKKEEEVGGDDAPVKEESGESAKTASPTDSEAAEGTTAADATQADKDKAEKAEATGDIKPESDKDKAADKKDKKEDKKKPKAKKEKKVKKDRTLRRVLTVIENISILTPPVWSHVQVLEARGRLKALDVADKARRDREAALNDLEGYIYKVKNRLDEEENEFKKISTDEQREEVTVLCSSTQEWLDEESTSADMKTFKAKQAAISKIAEPIFSRLSELTKRPAEIKAAMKDLADVRVAVSRWNETHPQITTNETDAFMLVVDKADEWIKTSVAAQEEKKPHEEPAFHSKEIKPQTDAVAIKMQVLLKKPKPKPVLVKEVRNLRLLKPCTL